MTVASAILLALFLLLISDLCSHIYDIYSGFVAVRSSLLRPIIQEGDKSSWDPLVGAEYWPWWPLSRLLLLRCHIQILSILALHKVCISAYLHLHDLWGCWVRTFLRYICWISVVSRISDRSDPGYMRTICIIIICNWIPYYCGRHMFWLNCSSDKIIANLILEMYCHILPTHHIISEDGT